MKHAIFGRKLGRDINSRKALLNNLASSLFENGQITTTLAKAKFAQSYVEKMVTSEKRNRLAKRRVLASNLSKSAFNNLTKIVVPQLLERNGGYTKISKIGIRHGDASKMAK